MAKLSHGGKRKHAGRKPVSDKRITVSIYPLSSEVEKVGGIENARLIALAAITRKASRK